MALQQTLIILKPDAVGRRLVGRILQRFEDKGLHVAAMKLMKIPVSLARKHYAEHKGKPFYPSLINFITSGPVVLMVLEGNDAIAVCRKMMGATFGPQAEPGTLRGDFGISRTQNLVHGSDSLKSAKREIRLFFKKAEMVPAPLAQMGWIYDCSGRKPE